MQVCYFALRRLDIGTRTVEIGGLIPEASEWKWLRPYVEEGKIAPVLVATLPRPLQDQVKQWEKEQEILRMMERDPGDLPEEEPVEDDEDDEEAEQEVTTNG